MKTQRIPNGSILRLVGDGSTSPEIPAATRLGILPTTEELNTTKIPASEFIDGSLPGEFKYKAKYPGVYTFHAKAGLSENGAKPMEIYLRHIQGEKETASLGALGSIEPDSRTQAQVQGSFRLDAGDLVSFDLANSDASNAVSVWPHASGYSFEVQFTELPVL